MSSLLLFAVFAPVGATSDVVVELKFDRMTIRRGDVAYCVVRVVNKSDEPRELAAPVPVGNVWFKVELAGKATARWQTGGGGLFGGFKHEIVASDGSLVTWAQVPLFTAKVLRETKGDLRLAKVTGVYYNGPKSHQSEPARIAITGDISRSPNKRDLVRQLYVPLELQPEMNEEWDRRMRKTPQIRDLLGPTALGDIPWTLSVPAALESFRSDLVKDCAVYRIASITAALQQCVLAEEANKATAITQLSREFERCGSAERKWFVRQIPFELEEVDSVSRRLFIEAFPSHAEEYKALPADEKR